MISIEQKILACSADLNPDPYQQQRMRHLMSHDIDVDHLINMAIKEGLGGLLYKSLMKSGMLETLEHRQRERLQSLYYQTVRFNLNLIHELKEVLHLLNQKKIQVVLLQGIALMQQIYDDIGLRPMTDIDLWVLQKDYLGLISILRGQGYEKDPIYPNTFRKGSTIFDLHTHILGADRIKARTLLLPKGQNNIFNNTRIIQFEDRKARCLSQYDQILYLSLHALKHNVDRLVWLVDIKTLIANWSESDWEAFINRAGELGQRKSISYILFLLIHLLDFQMPPKVRQFLEGTRLNFFERHLLMRRVRNNSLPIWAPLLLFSPEKGMQKRFIFILETLFPRPEILRQVFVDFPERKVWQLYCMRVLQLLRMIKISLKVRFGL